MENFNFNLAKAEITIDQLLSGIPVGAAYFMLKTKLNEIEKLYYEQAQKEYADLVQKQPQDQTVQQNETETA